MDDTERRPEDLEEQDLEDVEGHRRREDLTGDDDVEGHRRREDLTGDDDVEGHRRR